MKNGHDSVCLSLPHQCWDCCYLACKMPSKEEYTGPPFSGITPGRVCQSIASHLMGEGGQREEDQGPGVIFKTMLLIKYFPLLCPTICNFQNLPRQYHQLGTNDSNMWPWWGMVRIWNHSGIYVDACGWTKVFMLIKQLEQQNCGWALLPQLLVKRMLHRLAYRPSDAGIVSMYPIA